MCPRTLQKSVQQPARQPQEHLSAVLLGAKKYVVAVQSLDLEQGRVGDSETGIDISRRAMLV
jgi:hypothetical protein